MKATLAAAQQSNGSFEHRNVSGEVKDKNRERIFTVFGWTLSSHTVLDKEHGLLAKVQNVLALL